MIRKITAVILAVISLVCWGLGIIGTSLRSDYRLQNGLKFIPIEEFTGVCAKADLKADCRIKEACSFDETIYWVVHHYGYMSENANRQHVEVPSKGLSNEDIYNLRIIDVYGDKCTILFTSADIGSYSYNYNFCAYDFPLSDLEYNESKVSIADDGVQNRLGRYTTKERSEYGPVMLQIRKTLREYAPGMMNAAILSTIGTIVLLVIEKRKEEKEAKI